MNLLSIVADEQRKLKPEGPLLSMEAFYEIMNAYDGPIHALYDIYTAQHKINCLMDALKELHERMEYLAGDDE